MSVHKARAALVVSAGLFVVLAATVAYAAPAPFHDTDQSPPADAETVAAARAAEADLERACGADPCAPHGESSDGPCGADPCAPHGESSDGPCGADPCAPHDDAVEACVPGPCESADARAADRAEAADRHDFPSGPADEGDEGDPPLADEAGGDRRAGEGDVRELLASGDRLEVASDRGAFPQPGWSLALAVLLAVALSVTAGARRWRRRSASGPSPAPRR